MCVENKRLSKCPFCDSIMPDDIGGSCMQYDCTAHGAYNLTQAFIAGYKDCLDQDPLLLKRISRYLYETRDSSGFRVIDGASNYSPGKDVREESPKRVLHSSKRCPYIKLN